MKPKDPKIVLAALFVMLIAVTNPELRALLMLAQALGAEMLMLMVWLQLRSFWPFVASYARRSRVALGVALCRAGYALRVGLMGLLPREGLWLAGLAAIIAIEHGARAILPAPRAGTSRQFGGWH